ncbi:MAG: HAMP domain-containing sensor histidine kinase [Pseudomonadota bacterium]
MRFLPKSLGRRLLLVAAILYALVSLLSWIAINAAVERPARRAVDAQMETLTRELRGRWTTAQITGVFPSQFDLRDFHWSVSDARGEVYLSEVFEAEGIIAPELTGGEGAREVRTIASPIGELSVLQEVRAESLPALPGSGPSDPILVTYTVAISSARYEELIAERVDALRRAALGAFAGFGVLMLILIVILVALVLAPLRRLDRAAERYAEGESLKIDGQYPSEIQAVVENLNTSIDRNEKLVERTRRYIGKIAHDLKHPLAVTRNVLSHDGDPEIARSRLEAMGSMLDRYAQLATSIGPDGPHPALGVRPFLEGAREGFLLLYRSAPLAIDLDCPPDLTLRMAETDLDAIVANLMSNAHRHARSRILVTASRQGGHVRITVEDDGPGLTEEARRKAMSWGERLDTSAPGSGFGLAIVADQAALYAGDLMLERSERLGGLSASVTLPEV